MDIETALNIARGCVVASAMENKSKMEVIDALNSIEAMLIDMEDDEDV